MSEQWWGVQLGDDGSMDVYESEEEARQSARGCPIWKVTYELIERGKLCAAE